jgi:hypothetical protein
MVVGLNVVNYSPARRRSPHDSTMQQTDIFQPFFAMMLLTLVVWIHMYVIRTRFLVANRVDLRKVNTPEKAAQVIPEAVALPAHNLKNLFELPIVFYAVCLFLFVTDSVDRLHLIAAWWFVAFRVLHSVIHCTKNVVIWRFASYVVSAAGVWLMVIRSAIDVFGPA